jgi:hypothetical protein
VGHFPGERGASIVHREHNAFDFQAWIERGRRLIDGGLELVNAFQREEFALHRYQHCVRGNYAIKVEPPLCRRSVDQEIGIGHFGRSCVLLGDQLLQDIAQPEGAVTEYRVHQVEIGRHDLEIAHQRLFRRVRNGGCALQHIARGRAPGVLGDPEAGRSITPGVKIDNEDFLTIQSKRGAKIDCGSSSADTTFGIIDGQDAQKIFY